MRLKKAEPPRRATPQPARDTAMKPRPDTRAKPRPGTTTNSRQGVKTVLPPFARSLSPVARSLSPVARLVLGLALVLAIALGGCTGEPNTPPTFGTAAITPPPTSARTTQTPQAASAEPASFSQVWAASVSSVQGLGPVRVNVRETWDWRFLDSDAAPQGESASPQNAQVEELLDPSTQRARLTLTGPEGASETTVVDGKVQTTVSHTGTEGEGGVTTYRQIVSLEPPTGLPLPLWAGSAFVGKEGYLGLMDDARGASRPGTDAPRGEAWRLGDGRYLLIWERAGEDLKEEGEMKPLRVNRRLTLGPDFLPLRLEIAATVEVEGIAIESTGALDYAFEGIPPLTPADVTLEVPEDWSEKTVTYLLPLDRPYCPQADWGQYWLGTDFDVAAATTVQLTLQEAEYFSHEYRNLARGPQAAESDRFIRLSYLPTQPAQEDKSPLAAGGIEVTVRSPSAPAAKDMRQHAEQQIAAGKWQRRQATVAGEKATVYLGSWQMPPEGQGPARLDMLSVSLQEAWVQVQLFLTANLDDVLAALSRLTPAGSLP